MAYVAGNPKTKKALKELIAAGKAPEVFQPGLGMVPMNGRIALEGPHYPEPHKWYAQGTMKDGILISIR
jgi:hypothetical protein